MLYSEIEVEVDCSCGFEGDVTVWEDKFNHEWGWSCPVCGDQHVETLEEPEPYDTMEEWLIDNE